MFLEILLSFGQTAPLNVSQSCILPYLCTMSATIAELQHLLTLLNTERQEERRIFRERFLNMPLADRKKQGLTWYPIVIASEEIGIGDRLVLEITRHDASGGQAGIFSPGGIATLWSNAEPTRKNPPSLTGIVTKVREDKLFLAVEGDELPDWTDDGKLGLDIYYDERTYDEMEKAIKAVIAAPQKDRLAELREVLLGAVPASVSTRTSGFADPALNDSQNAAIDLVLRAEDVAVVHGPPGTGKTTTLVRAIATTLKTEKQVLVCAASNLATDLLTEKLAEAGVRVLRLGHPARVSEAVLQHSLDVQVAIHPAYKEMKGYRKEAEKIREKALKFKRQFGAAEREQRKDMLAEAKHCQKQARLLEQFIFEDLVNKAEAITCTLTGSVNSMIADRRFSTLFIDEAAQSSEPACWMPIRKADRVIFAGDHCQLPPTVKSREAEKGGLGVSLMEKIVARQPVAAMLRVQYRMHTDIMTFSSRQFYEAALQAAPSVADHHLDADPADLIAYQPVHFVDTAGCGYEEEQDDETMSRRNPGEAELCLRHLSQLLQCLSKPDREQLELSPSIGIISPYKAQVRYLQQIAVDHKPLWPWLKLTTIDTVDGFQGQERDIIYISMVRSNAEGGIGFLSDIRRMNVALTRARKKLVVIGDSATLAHHGFYQSFLDYVDEIGAYQSAWEFVEV
jgi:ATP-dependent RNA/DNA helicase IGHMBP2